MRPVAAATARATATWAAPWPWTGTPATQATRPLPTKCRHLIGQALTGGACSGCNVGQQCRCFPSPSPFLQQDVCTFAALSSRGLLPWRPCRGLPLSEARPGPARERERAWAACHATVRVPPHAWASAPAFARAGAAALRGQCTYEADNPAPCLAVLCSVHHAAEGAQRTSSLDSGGYGRYSLPAHAQLSHGAEGARGPVPGGAAVHSGSLQQQGQLWGGGLSRPSGAGGGVAAEQVRRLPQGRRAGDGTGLHVRGCGRNFL